MLFSISVLEGIAELAPSKCCWRNIGAVFRTAPFLIANVAQFLTICATTRGEGGEANELSKVRCACTSDVGASGQDEPRSSLGSSASGQKQSFNVPTNLGAIHSSALLVALQIAN